MIIRISQAINDRKWYFCDSDNKQFKFMLETFEIANIDDEYKNKNKIMNCYNWDDCDIWLLVFDFVQLSDDIKYWHPVDSNFKLIDEEGFVFEQVSDSYIKHRSLYAKKQTLHDFANDRTEAGKNYKVGLAFNLPIGSDLDYSLLCEVDDIWEM